MTMRPRVSFEFFPPTTEKTAQTLWDSVRRLAPLEPQFVSVTYGADGSTRDRTHRIVQRIQQDTELECAPHLTCVGASRSEIIDIARAYYDSGIRHMVALRGDPPRDALPYAPRADGFAYAVDLVAGLAEIGGLDISVAAYPETHPEAPSPEFDLQNLKRKIDAGASRAITQFFFDVEVFLRFRDRCAAQGIAAPIIPGILPITNFKRTLAFAENCGTRIPHWLHQRFDGIEDPAESRRIAEEIAIDQVMLMQDGGIEEFHFYTLNRAELTLSICTALGIHATRACGND